MSKHVIDHPKATNTARAAREFSRIDADAKPRQQTQALQKRARATSGKRLKAFTRIERRGVS